MFCFTLLYVHFSIAVILMGKRELIALLNLSSWCLVMVERLFPAVPRGCLQFVIVVFPDHTHLLFFIQYNVYCKNKSLQPCNYQFSHEIKFGGKLSCKNISNLPYSDKYFNSDWQIEMF